jgi:hypothetical protein
VRYGRIPKHRSCESNPDSKSIQTDNVEEVRGRSITSVVTDRICSIKPPSEVLTIDCEGENHLDKSLDLSEYDNIIISISEAHRTHCRYLDAIILMTDKDRRPLIMPTSKSNDQNKVNIKIVNILLIFAEIFM